MGHSAIVFDTHAYVKKLMAAGVSIEQAEVQAQALAEIVEDKLATKTDLEKLRAEITADIIKWVAGMLVAQAAVIAALVKLIK
ncbi:MAG: DUF1640 domain-containing protein [Nitrospirae bacterium]|nr:MAG: DUF1640 domain-containing protein [Nitrospirota bacterium]